MEIASLKRENEVLRTKNGIIIPPERYEAMMTDEKERKMQIDELQSKLKSMQESLDELTAKLNDRDASLEKVTSEGDTIQKSLSERDAALESAASQREQLQRTLTMQQSKLEQMTALQESTMKQMTAFQQSFMQQMNDLQHTHMQQMNTIKDSPLAHQSHTDTHASIDIATSTSSVPSGRTTPAITTQVDENNDGDADEEDAENLQPSPINIAVVAPADIADKPVATPTPAPPPAIHRRQPSISRIAAPKILTSIPNAPSAALAR